MLLGAPRLVVCFRWPLPAAPAARYLSAAERVVSELAHFQAVQIAWSADRFSYCVDAAKGAPATEPNTALLEWLAQCLPVRPYAVGVAFRPLKQRDNVGVWGPGLQLAEALASAAMPGELLFDAALANVVDVARGGRSSELSVPNGGEAARAVRWVPAGQTPPPPPFSKRPRAADETELGSRAPRSFQPTPRPSANLSARAPRKPILLEASDLEEIEPEPEPEQRRASTGLICSEPVSEPACEALDAALRAELPEVGSGLQLAFFAKQLRQRLAARDSKSQRGATLHNGILEGLAASIEGNAEGVIALRCSLKALHLEPTLGERQSQRLEVRAQLALSIALAVEGEPEESWLTALSSLARAREFADAEGIDACRRWLSNLARREGEFGAAAAWDVAV